MQHIRASMRFMSSSFALLRCMPRSAVAGGAHAFEPLYNGALLAFKLGDFQEAFDLVGEGGGLGVL
jgi:hypothetical protein